jgi:Putative zinc-finger
MADSESCAEVRELIPELAAGVASGESRARAVAHLAGCADCRRELEEFAGVVDGLLHIAPEHEPPNGFEARVLTSIQPRRDRHLLRSAWVIAAAFVLVAGIAAGVTWWRGAEDRDVADHYRGVLSVADGSYFRAAGLEDGGAGRGNVFAYEGRPSWVFVTVDGAPSGTYHVRLVDVDGRASWIGVCTVRNGSGSWGTTVAVPIRDVARVEMGGDGLPTLQADFRG